jgi:integrase
VYRAVSRAAVKAGLVGAGDEPIGVHDLRHSASAFAFDAGLSVAEVARFLRHSNPSITLRTYAGLTDAAAARLGAKLAVALVGPSEAREV